MEGLAWRFVEARLRRSVPPESLAAVLGDLAEDYERRRATRGAIRANVWLLHEGRSLTQAYVASGLNRRRLLLLDDLHRAWRRLVSRPGVSLMCAGLLAVGIGLSTAMFSVVDSLLLRPAPFRDADRLIRQGLGSVDEPALMNAWLASGLLDRVEAGRASSFRFGGDDAGWPGAFVTPGLFDLLGARPLRGRTFATTDGRADSSDEVVLSETIWRTVFGADASLLGRRIQLNGATAVVVGIMPAAFRFPTPTTVVWKPLVPAPYQAGLFFLFGRVKPDVSLRAAEFQNVAAQTEFPTLLRNVAMRHGRFANRIDGPPIQKLADPALGLLTPQALWLLLGGVGLVFVVLCANVSSLLLAGLSARRREFSLSTALGATRARLLRQATFEHALIGLAGAAAGLALAWSLTSLTPSVFLGRTLNQIDIDPRALWVASCLGVASVLLSGLIPAWLGTRADALGALRGSRQGDTDTPSSGLTTRSLLVVEIALACSLLLGSVLLVRSFSTMVNADSGMNSEGVVRVSVTDLDDAFGSGEAMALASANIEARFAAWPAIGAVALSREIPPSLSVRSRVHLRPPGASVPLEDTVASASYRVGPSFFKLYGIPILRGRTFQPGDTLQEAIVGERLAGVLWPGEDPLGRSFTVGSSSRRVVGVAGEIRLPTLDATLDLPEFYTPMGNQSRTLFINFRCAGPCPNEAAIRAQVQAVHTGVGARVVAPTEDAYLSQLQLPRATAEVGGIFAVVAVLTAAGGLFSVLTYAVGRRRREFGIRAALGASPGQVKRLVVREGMSIVAIGVAVGVAGGLLVARSLGAFLYGVTGADPMTWVAVIATVALTTLVAGWRPALQAMRVDPVKLLREE